MSREELQAYLDSQLAEIKRYHEDQVTRCSRPIDFKTAFNEWVERHSANYQKYWFARRDGKDATWDPTL